MCVGVGGGVAKPEGAKSEGGPARGIGRDGGALAPELAVLFKVFPQGLQTGRNIDGDAKRSREANEERRGPPEEVVTMETKTDPTPLLPPGAGACIPRPSPARHTPAALNLGSVPNPG